MSSVKGMRSSSRSAESGFGFPFLSFTTISFSSPQHFLFFDQRSFDNHLGVAEELVRVDFGVFAFLEVRVNLHQPLYVRVGDENAFVAEIPFHGIEEFRAVNQLDLAPPSLQLAVRQDPDVGGDAGVEEEFVGQRDDALQPVVFDYPASDVALAAAGIAGEHRGAVQDDSDAAAAALHLGEHVLQEQQRSVGTAGCARLRICRPRCRLRISRRLRRTSN